jgi:hypothetical protein
MHNAEKDVPRCSAAVADFVADGVILVTRCRRTAGHPGRHSDKQAKKWDDSQTTWHVLPPGDAEPHSDECRRFADGHWECPAPHVFPPAEKCGVCGATRDEPEKCGYPGGCPIPPDSGTEAGEGDAYA